jgi:ribonuclease P protein component
MQPELSTSDEPSCTQLVDDLLSTPPSRALADGPQVWFGVVLPKRHARRAVTRTLLRRQIRAAMLRRDGAGAPGLSPGLWVVRLRAPFDPAAYPCAASEALRRATGGELDTLLGEAQRKLDVAAPACRGTPSGRETA